MTSRTATAERTRAGVNRLPPARASNPAMDGASLIGSICNGLRWKSLQEATCQRVERGEAISVADANAVDHRFVRASEVGEARQVDRVWFSAKLAQVVACGLGFMGGHESAACGCPYEREIESVCCTGIVVLRGERLCGGPPIGAPVELGLPQSDRGWCETQQEAIHDSSEYGQEGQSEGDAKHDADRRVTLGKAKETKNQITYPLCDQFANGNRAAAGEGTAAEDSGDCIRDGGVIERAH